METLGKSQKAKLEKFPNRKECLRGLISGLDMAVERISELEVTPTEISKTKQRTKT